jgi:ribonuclease T2
LRLALWVFLILVPACAQHTPGRFDYYVLSLSWSPEYCAGPAAARNSEQCGEGRRYGFVVHGLWPQYERGWPQDCAAANPVDAAIVARMLPLMPAEGLIQHQWRKHGTCSGLDAASYFEWTEKAFRRFQIPADFRQPLKQVEMPAESVRQKLLAANPSYPRGSIKLACRGRYLSEARICLTRNLEPRACSASVRDSCPASNIILRPVR